MAHLGSRIQSSLSKFPKTWDGKDCIVQMRQEGSKNWKQMEWIGWYFEHLCVTQLKSVFEMPGEKFRGDNVTFDGAAEGYNFDFKAHAWLTASGKRQPCTVLNDKVSMDESVAKYGRHGLLLALLKCEYDQDGSFKSWHESIKGAASNYVKEGITTGRKSRKRKVRAYVEKYVILTITKENIHRLPVMNQGKNSDGKPRMPKYGINLQDIALFSPIEI
jgi:hypothetical protein